MATTEKKFKKVRLHKVAKQLNLTIDDLVDHLAEKGYAEALSGKGLNAAITNEEAYLDLLKFYADDRETAERVKEKRAARVAELAKAFGEPLPIPPGLTLRHTLRGHQQAIGKIAWSPDGDWLASGSADGTIRIWDAENGKALEPPLTRHTGSINSVAWSPDGNWLASGSADGTIRIWDFRAGSSQNYEMRHTGSITSLAWSPSKHWLASGSADGTIQNWDAETGRQKNALEGHTNSLQAISFSADGHLLASKSRDGTVRLWRCDIWETVAQFPEPTKDHSFPSIAFHPRLPVLATLGENDTVIRIWDLDLEVLSGDTPTVLSVHHITTKIVLVGDSGVGKTGLGWRLTYGEFIEHPSTHGQQFWILDELMATRSDGTECEAVLWDLAGQPDYRLIHALFLDDADLALILFDPTDRQDPLHGVEYWLKALSHRPGGLCNSILVGARTDRGDATLTREEIDVFCDDRGISGGYISTSAFEGKGLDELYKQMKAQMVWDEMTATTTTQTFKNVKDYVLGLKEDEDQDSVLTDLAGLREQLLALTIEWYTDAEVMAALEHLAKHGYVQILRTASGEQRILLAPDLLNNLAASFILEARRNPKGLGALNEDRVLSNDYHFSELVDLSEEEQNILLDAVTVLFLDHNICFREKHGNTPYLIFPKLINQKKPVLEGAMELIDNISYTIKGAVENVYAALVVLLGYTNAFTRTNQWQNQAQYEVERGEICGFRQLEEREGEIDLVLYYAATVEPHIRLLFQGLFEKFLAGRNVSVTRYPPLVCSNCNYPQERAAVVRRIRAGKRFIFCDDCGEKIDLPALGEEVALDDEERILVERQQAHAHLRTKFEAALAQVNAFLGERKKPSCFVSYAWDNAKHEKWVETQLARDLQNVGIDVILDRWHNAEIGASLPRFIERIEEADIVMVVGTPLYLEKYQNKRSGTGTVVAAEVDLIAQRLLGT